MTEQKAETLSQELSQVLEEIVTTPEEEVKRAVMVGDTTVMIDDVHYEIVEDYRDGFNLEALNERYNDIFERYDYIVGDWGHEKLRLKGFFKHSHKLATPDRDIDYLQEYLLEYCNFGCQYFVLERDPEAQHKPVVFFLLPQLVYVAPLDLFLIRNIGTQNCNIPINILVNNRYRGLESPIYANV